MNWLYIKKKVTSQINKKKRKKKIFKDLCIL